jgi:hypothetical protein
LAISLNSRRPVRELLFIITVVMTIYIFNMVQKYKNF